MLSLSQVYWARSVQLIYPDVVKLCWGIPAREHVERSLVIRCEERFFCKTSHDPLTILFAAYAGKSIVFFDCFVVCTRQLSKMYK